MGGQGGDGVEQAEGPGAAEPAPPESSLDFALRVVGSQGGVTIRPTCLKDRSSYCVENKC